MTAVFRSEADVLAFIQTVTAEGAAIHADEAIHWDVLHDTFPVSRINHSEAYCKDGACTNQAESYFSRLRRMVQSQHQFVSPGHLHHSVRTRTASNGTFVEHFPATSTAVLHRPASNVNFTYKTLSKNMVSFVALTVRHRQFHYQPVRIYDLSFTSACMSLSLTRICLTVFRRISRDSKTRQKNQTTRRYHSKSRKVGSA